MSYSVFLDFDGTLLPVGQTKISDRTLAALTDAQAKGHKIFLNTGRALSFLNVDAFRGFRFDGYLCGSAYINVRGKVLMADGLTADETQPIVAHFYGRDVIVLLEGENTMWAAYDTEGIMEKDGMIPLNDMQEIFRVCELEPITKMNVLTKLRDEEDLAFVRQFADPVLREDEDCTELVPKGHDKAYVMNAVVTMLELDPETVVAIGDSNNDLPMLDAAPISVAMGNASDKVKAHAKFVTSSAEQDGVAEFLEGLLK